MSAVQFVSIQSLLEVEFETRSDNGPVVIGGEYPESDIIPSRG